MFALYGTRREDFSGAYDAWTTRLHPDDKAIGEVAAQDAPAGKTNYAPEFRVVWPDGSVHCLNANARIMRDEAGKPLRMVGSHVDITERKQAEQQVSLLNRDLVAANYALQEALTVAEKASLVKSNFLAGVSHDLRTPLNAMLGFAQLIESGSPPPTPAQKKYLTQVIKGGWFLLDLINELLDLSSIESGKLQLSLEPVLLIDVIRECSDLAEFAAQERDVHLSVFPFDNGWMVHADRTRIKQILNNLISNAIKYNQRQGSIEVKCTVSGSERIRVSVRDGGVGLPREKLSQLFQPFNRLGQESGVEEGTGLGLALSKRLVELMGGSIGVESTVGVGSEFWFELLYSHSMVSEAP